MKLYKADNKYIAVESKGNTVYSAHGKTEEEAKRNVIEMVRNDKQ